MKITTQQCLCEYGMFMDEKGYCKDCSLHITGCKIKY